MHVDEDAMTFLPVVTACSVLLPSSAVQVSAARINLHEYFCSSLCTTGDICVAETRVDNVDNDERGFGGGTGGNGADGETLEEFTGLIAAAIAILAALQPVRRSYKT